MYSPPGAYLPPPQPRASRMPGNRGTWWSQLLISAALTVGLYVVSVASAYLVTKAVNTSDASIWVSFTMWSVLPLLFVVILGVWGRSALRAVLGTITALFFLALSQGALAFWYATDTIDWSIQDIHVLFGAINATFLIGTIAGWSIARRRTWFAAIGTVPAFGVVVLGTWLLTFHPLDFGWNDDRYYYELNYWLAYMAVTFALVILGVVLVWACDGLSRLRSTNPPSGPPPFTGGAGHPVGNSPWPSPPYQQYQQYQQYPQHQQPYR